MYYDIIIIGSGISGLYAAYNIQKMSPSTSFIILEKYKKNWIGGRTSNDMFIFIIHFANTICQDIFK